MPSPRDASDRRFPRDRGAREADEADEYDVTLVEGIDYYVENGYVVMTANYLEKRGWCCRNGCRHCPYGFGGEGGEAKPRGGPPDPPGQGRLF